MSTRASYPKEAITFISAAPPGGGWYQVCEYTIRALREEGLVPVDLRMEERRGAVKLFEEMATERKGDSNTLVACSPGTTIQLLNAKSRYSYEHVTPIAATSTDYGVLAVSKNSPLKSLDDLVKMLRRDPQAVSLGGGQPAGLMHHGIVTSVAVASGLDPSRIRYAGSKNPAEAISSLMAGQVVATAMGAANAVDDLRKGTVRLLAILSEKRLADAFKGVPTGMEQGLKVTFPMWRGFYAAAGISGEAVEFWGKTLTRLAGTKTWSRVLGELGWFPFLLTGDRFASFLKEDTLRYRVTAS